MRPRSSRSTSSKNNLSSLKRGLAALRLVNQYGRMTGAELARQMNIPRTTAQRIMDTLALEGYLEKNASDPAYLLTEKVDDLSIGHDSDALISRIAHQVLAQASELIPWPMSFSTASGIDMLTQATTEKFNPLAIMRRHRGFMLPMLFTATGHVFLAFCPDSVRGTLLDLMARSDDERHAPSRRRHETDQKLAAIRNDGYFIFELDGYAEGGCAVPVSVRGNVVGAVAMKYIMTAIRPAQVKKQWLPALREVCRTLGDRLVAANSQ